MTKLEYFNMALAHIGKPQIDAVDDTSESASFCRAFGDAARQLFLKQSKLHLARKEVDLAIATGETSDRYTYVYGLPADCLHPIVIWAGSTTATPILYVIETHSNLNSSVVKTDDAEPVLIYMVDIPLMNRYNIDDVFAMSYLLASLIAMPLKVDTQLQLFVEQKYAIALSVSIANDQNSQSEDIINDDRYNSIIDSRN